MDLTNKFRQAPIEEIQNTYNVLTYLDQPSHVKSVLNNLDPGNLSKILNNLPEEETEKIYDLLTPMETLDTFLRLNLSKNECFTNNITTAGSDMNYTLLQICKR
jgi:Mg/Co/Ni transporter MgtE